MTTLWGAGEGFALGALVLGAALRRSGTRHDLVLLHTHDVRTKSLELLGRVWTRLIEVDPIRGDDGLYTMLGLSLIHI